MLAIGVPLRGLPLALFSFPLMAVVIKEKQFSTFGQLLFYSTFGQLLFYSTFGQLLFYSTFGQLLFYSTFGQFDVRRKRKNRTVEGEHSVILSDQVFLHSLDMENERIKLMRLEKEHAEWWEWLSARHERNLKLDARLQALLEANKRLESDNFFKDTVIRQLTEERDEARQAANEKDRVIEELRKRLDEALAENLILKRDLREQTKIAQDMLDRNDRLEKELESLKKSSIEKENLIASLYKRLDTAFDEIVHLKKALDEQIGITEYWRDKFFQMKNDNEQLMATPSGVGTFSRSLPSTAVGTFPSLKAELQAYYDARKLNNNGEQTDDAEQLNSNGEQTSTDQENKQFLLHLLIYSIFGLIMIAITLPFFLNTSMSVPSQSEHLSFKEQNSDTSIMSFSNSKKDPAYSSMFNSSQWLDNEVCPVSGSDLGPFDDDYMKFNSNNEQTEKDIFGIAVSEDDISGITVSEEDISGIAVSEEDISGIAVSEDDISGITVSEEDISGIAVSEDDISGITVSEEDTSGITVSEEDIPGITVSEEDTSSLSELKFTGDFSLSPTPEREDNLQQKKSEEMLHRAELVRSTCKFASRIKQKNSVTSSIMLSGSCKFFSSLFGLSQRLEDEDMLRDNQYQPEELVDDGVSSLMEQIWS
uniref:Uncharacterized protein n=1 Tax=Globodera rostochiensis TaxID=31243 RepID=A0A914I2B1_GLORO